MKLKIIFILSLLIIPLLLVGCEESHKYDDFAKCLTNNGAVMYGTDTCRYCNLQKAEFEGSFEFINYVNCIEDNAACINNDIDGFPTWIIDGEKYEGKISLAELGVLAKCELPLE